MEKLTTEQLNELNEMLLNCKDSSLVSTVQALVNKGKLHRAYVLMTANKSNRNN